MNTLITPAQAVASAFTDGEYLAPEAIGEGDIAAAEQRYIVPVIGRAFHEKLLAGLHAGFTAEYLAAPVALFTRIAVQPRLDIRTGQCGTVAPKSGSYQPADAQSLRELQRSLRRQARTLLQIGAALGVPYELVIASAHRTPAKVHEWASTAADRGIKVIIAAAGKAAHLGGVVAAFTPLPVIGVPMKTSDLGGMDSLLSMVQMPSGVPVACVAINGAKNAAIYATQILGACDPEYRKVIEKMKQEMADA